MLKGPHYMLTSLMALILSTASGCGGDAAKKKDDGKPAKSTTADKGTTADKTATKPTPDDGWWCVEHGIPEDNCALCNQKVAADFKKKGDWCKEHDRPDSQCFHCHPEYIAKFAALYEARYGSKPPKPELEETESTDEKDTPKPNKS